MQFGLSQLVECRPIYGWLGQRREKCIAVCTVLFASVSKILECHSDYCLYFLALVRGRFDLVQHPIGGEFHALTLRLRACRTVAAPAAAVPATGTAIVIGPGSEAARKQATQQPASDHAGKEASAFLRGILGSSGGRWWNGLPGILLFHILLLSVAISPHHVTNGSMLEASYVRKVWRA
jgi:hypothetical protein